MKHYDFIKKSFTFGYSVRNDGVLLKNGRVQATQVLNSGYMATRIYLSTKHKNPTITVHQISWVYFHGTNVENINHIDGNKFNNRPENLEESSCSDNNKHAYKLKLRTPNHGVKSGRSTLTDADIIKMRALVASGELQRDVSRAFGIAPNTLSYIINRRTWFHI